MVALTRAGYAERDSRNYKPHLDSRNHGYSYNLVVPFGTFSGADIVFPDQNVSVQVGKGDLIMFDASRDKHFISPLKGSNDCRNSIIIFNDKFLVEDLIKLNPRTKVFRQPQCDEDGIRLYLNPLINRLI